MLRLSERLGLVARCVKDVQGREHCLADDAVPEKDCQAQIAGPEGVAELAVSPRFGFCLAYGVHCERSRAVQPARILCSPIQLQKGVSVSSSAVAQVRTLAQRPGSPDRLTRSEKQAIEFSRREVGQADIEPALKY